ncbi:RQC-minor-2 family DNA-binding protein [Halobacillus naozhouensis]|uniref:RQC-minor-2 family DNA-binding protein n=1 Tax=Halobacillus naozhouensis TaxID=554880 RepID=A0ABY8IWG5_9BACI|nr:RQC-minor-2 family DNA-binding protein [Halobacillus naozhouensis]WFT74564.1 RQC-minor-2 family DNA-binding protein [Halobacillus naozhouensis]
MGLPESMTYKNDRYPYIILTPIGNMNKQIRSIGHKFERGLLSRINEVIADQVKHRSLPLDRLQRYLSVEGNTVLPVSFIKDDTLNPYLIRPELFLWTELTGEDGLPFDKRFLYDTNITHLSSEKLEQHLIEVIKDHLFVAEIAEHSRDYWLTKIAASFDKHPLVQLTQSKRDVIEAVEQMNQSALLSQLKYPEDVAMWRDHVTIVMRPFRTFPKQWFTGRMEMCRHDKQLGFYSTKRTVGCRCDHCDYTVYYHLDSDQVTLQEEFHVERARKRIETIEHQFNEIAAQNKDLTHQIQELINMKGKLRPVQHTLDEALSVARQIERYQEDAAVANAYPLLEMHHKLSCSTLPQRGSESLLIWLSRVELSDVVLFKQLLAWRNQMDDQVNAKAVDLLHQLQVRLDEAEYTEEDIIITIKGHELSYSAVQQVLDLVHYYGTDHPAHTLVQVLAGKSTNKLRRLQLHETRWFGLLAEWPPKHIQRLFNQLEKQGWLMKQRKGYSISDFAEEVM